MSEPWNNIESKKQARTQVEEEVQGRVMAMMIKIEKATAKE